MNTYSIGIDIGGTNTDIGLVRDDGRVMAKKNLPTNKYFDAARVVVARWRCNADAIDGFDTVFSHQVFDLAVNI